MCYYYCHFIDENVCSERISNFPSENSGKLAEACLSENFHADEFYLSWRLAEGCAIIKIHIAGRFLGTLIIGGEFRVLMGFPGGSEFKESACNLGDLGSIPGLGRSPGEGNSYPLQYSCLENSTDRGTWWATVHRVTNSWTRLSDFHFTRVLTVSERKF